MLKEISHLHHGAFLLNTLVLDLETGGPSRVLQVFGVLS